MVYKPSDNPDLRMIRINLCVKSNPDYLKFAVRYLNLLQQVALLIAIRRKYIPFNNVQANNQMIDNDFKYLTNFMINYNLDDLSQPQANMSYFVGGYIDRSTIQRIDISSYKEYIGLIKVKYLIIKIVLQKSTTFSNGYCGLLV